MKKGYVKKLILADIFAEGAEKFVKKLCEQTSAEIVVRQADASSTESVVAILTDVDVLLYTRIPEYNFKVMQACLDTKTHDIDMASDGPDSLLQQLDWDGKFKQAGIVGIMGLGCNLGFSNVAARYAAD
ncbi:hypothetical protein ACH33_15915 [Aneurinibacillus sp. XH2]|uniref:saccharopine dehydrogenase NADP-binding domain-containing protein n=1 Tax=Aneurinibacillus sp. XH2 TaxID=1450761 RepID=UPI00070F030E|nr:saccharopine dehydrogenase NADP-binding domain-containing protein [Aneurinibacillus sp. XH2]AMA74157.1 hypothetical protein ACH33_15915 [Aneurinibacillus sp. XH2]